MTTKMAEKAIFLADFAIGTVVAYSGDVCGA